MKFGKSIAVVLTSSLLLAGCTTDKGEIKAYDNQVQKAFDEEKPVTSISKKINSLEEEKKKLSNKVNSKDQNTREKAASDLVDNADQRLKEFKKEEDALTASEKEYKKAGKHIDNINNSAKQKEVKQLDDALKNKYKTHKDYADAYKKGIKAEKSLFTYLNEDGANQDGVDKRSKDIETAYKEMNKQFNNYSKAMNKVNQEKQDVDQLK